MSKLFGPPCCIDMEIGKHSYSYLFQDMSFSGLNLSVVVLDRSPAECFPKFMDECQQNWPYGLGKLTALGMNQTNTLGQFIRKRYMEKLKLIGQQPGREGQYSPLDIRVRSTSYDR